jgi:hypothetical protein
MNIPPVTKGFNKDGVLEYHLEFDSAWDGVESFAQYLKKYWKAEVIESIDDIYSRRWVLRSEGVPITIYHDSQIGNYFLREDGVDDQSLLEKIEADLVQRMR